MSEPATLVEMLRARAASHPTAEAFIALDDGETVSSRVNWAALDERVRAIAAGLVERHAAGERVLIVSEPALDFLTAFFGCLYAGATPVPLPMPRGASRVERLRAVVRDATPKYALVSGQDSHRIPAAATADGECSWLSIDDVVGDPAAWTPGPPTALAYLQYTSGSTAAPKGVMVSHENVLRNLAYIDSGFRHTAESVSVSWLPFYHDMGLVYGVLQPIWNGFTAVLMPPGAFVQRPIRWLRAIERFRATHSGGPNFAYDLCVRRVAAQDAEGLDLTSWRVAFNGAEPVRAETVNEFAAMFAPCGFRPSAFYPAYGLAEATLKVSGKPADRDRIGIEPATAREMHAAGRRLVSSGNTSLDTEIRIVDPATAKLCPDGVVGEVWVSGPGVALGYWNRPTESDATFRARLNDGIGRETYLRTGDLGLQRDGELFITGRLKDVIIVRGENHHPEDIEAIAENVHPALRRGAIAAFEVEHEQTSAVTIVAELPRGTRVGDAEQIGHAVAAAIREQQQVPLHSVVLVLSGALPRTTSGKLQRHECRRAWLAGDFTPIWSGSWTDSLEISTESDVTRASLLELDVPARYAAATGCVRATIASVLRTPVSTVSIETPLVVLGVDSLAAGEVSARLYDLLGVEIGAARLLSGVTASAVASEIVNALSGESAGRRSRAAAADRAETHPLSYPQLSIWAMYLMNREGAAYNISRAFRIRQPLDRVAFDASLQYLVDHHAALRSTFRMTTAGPVCDAHDQLPTAISYVDIGVDCGDDEETTLLAAEAERPFVLEHGPLLRLTVFNRGEAEHIVLLSIHHIVADLWSMELLVSELGATYADLSSGRTPNPPPSSADYREYVSWSRELVDGAEGNQSWAYWRAKLDGVPTSIELPGLGVPPIPARQRGTVRHFRLPARITARLQELASTSGATMNMVLLAAYAVFLRHYSRQDRFCIGTPVSTRPGTEFDGTVGNVVNTAVIPIDVRRDPTFVELLGDVRASVLGALEHAQFPFVKLVEQLPGARSGGRHPLYQTLFAFHRGRRLQRGDAASVLVGHGGAEVRIGPLAAESVAIAHRTSQFDLSLAMTEAGGDLAATFELDTDIFSDAAADRVVRSFTQCVESLCQRPVDRISCARLLPPDERRRIVEHWNDTGVSYAGDCLHALVTAQARRTPDAPAIVFEHEQISYAELDARADRVAGRLRACGAGPGVSVGVCLHRSAELPIALLATLKSGAAYVPIDPDYPDEYLAFVVRDAGLGVTIVSEQTAAKMSGYGGRLVRLPNDLDDRDVPPVPVQSRPDDLAYVIYTSGSTGRPKGVMNTHRGICNRLHWMQSALQLEAADVVVQKTPFTFDVSVWEFFWPLMQGACLVVARPGGHQDVSYLLQLIEQQRITTIHFVPSMLRAFLDAPDLSAARSLTRMVCSGEALPTDLHDRCLARLDARLFNLYGPTEAAVDVTWWRCHEPSEGRRIPIGLPIANTRMHVLDEWMEPVPVGVPGQIFIGGVGLARGYVNRPALTAERFLPDPLGPHPGCRLYATGDIGRYREDGALEFLDRMDHQVKVRGFRVELDEVAAALRQCPGVLDAVVVVAVDDDAGRELVAYVVSAGHALRTTELRSAMAARVPEFMIPAVFAPIDRLPLTPSGKVDRRALPAVDRQRSVAAAYVPPRDEVEESVAEIWAEVFSIDRVGVHDEFFELGGHSLRAMQIVRQVHERFGLELPLVLLLSGSPTVESVASALSQQLAVHGRTQPAAHGDTVWSR